MIAKQLTLTLSLTAALLCGVLWLCSFGFRIKGGVNIPATEVAVAYDSGLGWAVLRLKKRHTDSYVSVSGARSAFRGGRTEWRRSGESPRWQFRWKSGYTIAGAMFPLWLPLLIFAAPTGLLCLDRLRRS